MFDSFSESPNRPLAPGASKKWSVMINIADIPTFEGSCQDVLSGEVIKKYKFKVELCLSELAAGKKYGIYLSLLPTVNDVYLFWPMPFEFNIAIISKVNGVADVTKNIPNDVAPYNKDWSLYIGNESGAITSRVKRVGWESFITGYDLISRKFMSENKVEFKIEVLMEKEGKISDAIV